MLKTWKADGELPYRIEVDNLSGAGTSPATAAMAALSAGGRIPVGMRDGKAAAAYIFWRYEHNPEWLQLIRILEINKFEEVKDEQAG